MEEVLDKERDREVPNKTTQQKTYSSVVRESFRSSAEFDSYVKDGSDQFILDILVNTTRDILHKEICKLPVKPFAAVRVKGKVNVWRLSFQPTKVEELNKLKRSGEIIQIGELNARNLHYAPGGTQTNGRVYVYFIDMQESLKTKDGTIREKLEEQGVKVNSISRDSIYGIETGIVSVYATSEHDDKKISFTDNGLVFPLQRVESKLQRKRVANVQKAKENGDKVQEAKTQSKRFSYNNQNPKKIRDHWRQKKKLHSTITVSNRFEGLTNEIIDTSTPETDDKILEDVLQPVLSTSSDTAPKTSEKEDKTEEKKEEVTEGKEEEKKEEENPPKESKKVGPTVTVKEGGYGPIKEIVHPENGLTFCIPLNKPSPSKQPTVPKEGTILKNKKEKEEEDLMSESSPLKNKKLKQAEPDVTTKQIRTSERLAKKVSATTQKDSGLVQN